MDKVQSIADIAKALHLSVSTVSRALSGKGRMSPETRKKILKYAESHEFTPNSIAQSLVNSKANSIAFLMTHDTDDEHSPFFQQCLTGICKKASQYSFDTIVINSDKEDEVELKRLIAKRKVDGVILNRELKHNVLSVLEQYHTPFVLLGVSEDSSVNQVDTDVIKSGEELTLLLINEGYKKLAFIGDNSTYTVNKRRLKGFTNICLKHGVSSEHIYTTEHSASQCFIENAVQKIHSHCNCIITNDDRTCLRVMHAIEKMGLAIPSQMKLATMYHSYILDLQTPQITGINNNPLRVGENAVMILISIIENDDYPKRGNKIWVDYELLIRKSTSG